MKILRSNEFFLSEQHAFCLFILNNQQMEEVHGHEFDELVIVVAGSGFHIINDSVEFIYQGDFFFVTFNDTHSYLSTNHLSVINLLIRRERNFQYITNLDVLLRYLCGDSRQDKVHAACLSTEEVAQIVAYSNAINARNDDDYDALYFFATESIVMMMINQLCQSAARKNLLEKVEDARRKKLIHSLKHNYLQHINWSELSEECGIAKRTLFRFIKEITGYTPVRFQLLFRLLKAQELLRTTDKSVKEVAASCGFQNATRLTESYKRQFSYPPSQERNRQR
ncbi:hypothetical protein CHU32_13950 [Superficieibacter electus]|uniref:HTH araC/xylS-type domain-containing protein n=1 Tax=Superficieibacter electus TaxID=2022662 RepID=A0A2P5GPA7_9ENTR|nr:helix-turn-helix domain-containing protein [Superficieibacter electus]POP44979.1 hypothetical protein CHU33_11025 [Superficieibacter electus]POP48366.1 hypothetical protein CHU32_13950 [Superficieibacter electus]